MLPADFCERMKGYLGPEEYESFVESFGDDTKRFHALRINRLKAQAPDIPGILENVPWEEDGYYYDNNASPGKSPLHEAGLYYIQEPSAMAPVHFLEPGPCEKILDLCASPGGKSTQIATKMAGEGILISNEINKDRAKILSLNIERLGIRNCMVLNETPEHLSDVFEGYFDKILVDAPCSGEGMFRKNENAQEEWSLDNVRACAARQEGILDCASRMLKPGGRLVYSTCTFSAEENEVTISKFLLSHEDFYVEKTELIGGMEYAKENLIPEEKENIKSQVHYAVRLWPHKLKGEGHFFCVMKRKGELIDPEKDTFIPGGKNISAKKEQIKLFEEFAKDTFSFPVNISAGGQCNLDAGNNALKGIITMFGDQMYLTPSNMPSTAGLKVLRPGLHLGTVKKDRFEPSHALALTLGSSDVAGCVNFGTDSDEIRKYLNGETLRFSGQLKKGWTLITADGYSLGWVKAAGGMLKNHYPKGLRIYNY